MSRKVTLIMTLIVLIGTLTLEFNIQRAECSEPPPTEWTKTYGGDDFDYAWSVVETSDGGYALAGWTNSFGAGGYDFWLVKVDSSGSMEWNRTYGGAIEDYAYSVVETSDGGYALAGRTDSFGEGSSDAWLVKVDSAGNHEWNQTYGGGGKDWAYSVVETSDGGYALAGCTDSFGSGQIDSWLIKVDSSGNHEWNQTYGGDTDDHAYSFVETSDGGYALAGWTNSFGEGGYDFWLVKVDSSGNHEWNQTYGGETDDRARSVVETSDGYALAGWTDSFGEDIYDFWLVKVDSSGNMEWAQTYGGDTNVDRAESIVETIDGGYALAGFTDSFGEGSSDAWLVKVAGDQTPDDDGPTPDDGAPTPDEDSGLSAFYIGLAITIILAIVATVVFVKLKKKRRKKETINLPFRFFAFSWYLENFK